MKSFKGMPQQWENLAKVAAVPMPGMTKELGRILSHTPGGEEAITICFVDQGSIEFLEQEGLMLGIEEVDLEVTPDPPSTYTTRDVTELRGWSRGLIQKYIGQGRLTPTKNESGNNIFDAAQVNEFQPGAANAGGVKGRTNKNPRPPEGRRRRTARPPLPSID